LYDALRAERARHRISLKDLAKVLGISITAMNNRIAGKADWRLTEAKKTVDYFNSKGSNVTIEDLFFKE
jgi:DNA-binding XRE family transcriptional regulator